MGTDTSLPELFDRLKSPDVKERIQAAEALGRSGEQDAVSALVNALENHEPTVRLAAVVALGRLGGPQTPQHLFGLLSDRSAIVRGAAAITLTRLNAYTAIGPLARAARSESDPAVRDRMAASLDILRQSAATAGVPVPRTDDHGPTPDAIDAAVRQFHSRDLNKRVEAARFLGASGDARAVGPLSEWLRSRDGTMRVATIMALAAIGRHKAVAPVESCLCDGTALVRVAAAHALGQLESSGSGSVSALETAIKRETEPSVQRYLESALARLPADLSESVAEPETPAEISRQTDL